jgi:hypothetical protein
METKIISGIEQNMLDIVFENHAIKESSCRKVARITFAAAGVFLSYVTLIPSVLTAILTFLEGPSVKKIIRLGTCTERPTKFAA